MGRRRSVLFVHPWPASGQVQFEYVNTGGLGVTVDGTGTWTTGWTAFTPFTTGGQGHLLIYKVATGDAKVVRLTPGGNSTTTLWSETWTSGWQ